MNSKQRMIDWFKKHVQVFKRLSEQRLLAKIQRGDKEAFGELYLRYLDKIYRYIFFRVNQEKLIAEDLTQTVFFKAWQGVDSFIMEKGNFRAWLYRIAHNSVIDYYKMEKAVSKFQDDIPDDKTELFEEHLDNEATLENVKHALSFLTDEQRTVVLLRFIDGFSIEEIAVITGKNEDAVRALQYRGLERLRKIVKKHE